MAQRLDEWGRDLRPLDQRQYEDTAGPTFSKFVVDAFLLAAKIGLVIGTMWTMAGLWHAHVHRLW